MDDGPIQQNTKVLPGVSAILATEQEDTLMIQHGTPSITPLVQPLSSNNPTLYSFPHGRHGLLNVEFRTSLTLHGLLRRAALVDEDSDTRGWAKNVATKRFSWSP